MVITLPCHGRYWSSILQWTATLKVMQNIASRWGIAAVSVRPLIAVPQWELTLISFYMNDSTTTTAGEPMIVEAKNNTEGPVNVPYMRPAPSMNADLFRQNFSKPSEENAAKVAAVKAKAQELYELIFTSAPDSRERSLGITHLEDAIMWVVKGLTA